MPGHEFALRLTGVTAITDELEGAVLAAGCDDATLSACNGVVSLDFTRAAPTRPEAVASAVRDVRAAGLAAELPGPAGEAA